MNKDRIKIVIVIMVSALIVFLVPIFFVLDILTPKKPTNREKQYLIEKYRPLEKTQASYIKENFEGVKEISFSPILVESYGIVGMGNMDHVFTIIMDEKGHQALLAGRIGGLKYQPNFYAIEEKKVDAEGEAESSAVDQNSISSQEGEKKAISPELDELIEGLVQDGKLEGIKKSSQGSPRAKIHYDLTIKWQEYTDYPAYSEQERKAR